MSLPSSRLTLIDALKAFAAQVIVLHHLTIYSPWRADASQWSSMPLTWAADYGRWAVQIFLVIGGFLAARSLAPQGAWRSAISLPVMVWRRYQRLVLPLTAVLLLAIVAAEVARWSMIDDSIPPRAQWPQLLAHLLLIQDVAGVESLSAGVWYVAIDLQLFALFAGLMWLGARMPTRWATMAGVWLTVAVATLALMVLNRDIAWDWFGGYFFGSYALGAFAWWGAAPGRRVLAALMPVLVVTALALAFRERLLVALATACLLWWGTTQGGLSRWGDVRPAQFLARISYAQFLVHYPVALVVHALAVQWLPDNATTPLLTIAAGWILAVVAAWRFHVRVEQPAMAWLDTRHPRGREPATPKTIQVDAAPVAAR